MLSGCGVWRKIRECGLAAPYWRNRKRCAGGKSDSRVGGPMRANEKWSGRWESNPNGRSFEAYKIPRFVIQRRMRAIGVRIFAL